MEASCSEALLEASCGGHLPTINAILRTGCDINEIIKKPNVEYTALGGAIKWQQEEAVKLLLSAGADVNLVQREWGYPLSPISFAVMNGNVGILKLLINAGASAHERVAEDQRTLLHVAADKGDVEVVRTLLAAGARVDARTKGNRMLPITLAVTEGNADVVELLIKAGASVHEHINEDEWTLLHMAATRGHVKVGRVLLAAGARLDARTKDQRMAPIAVAVTRGHAGVVELLINAGASVQGHMSSGFRTTLLNQAAGRGIVEVVKLLLSAGADVNDRASSENGFSALYVASEECQPEAVKQLLKAGAAVDAPDNNGVSPLLACLISQRAVAAEKLPAARKVVRRLIKAGADVNARMGAKGNLTALHAAATLSCPDIVQDLLDAGAEIEAKDNYGRVALGLVGMVLACEVDTKAAEWKQRVADTKAVLKRWKRTHAAGGGGKRQARTERGVITVGSSGGAGAGAGAPGSSLVLKGHFSGEVQDKKKKKKKKKKAVGDENRVCDGPDCSSLGVNRCKACKRPAYCGVECQRAHWNGGHKQECKLWREE